MRYPTRTGGSASASKIIQCGSKAKIGRSICGTGKELAESKTRLKELMEKNLVPTTDEFIKTLVGKQGLKYNLGKKGAERFYAENGAPIYPPNDDFIGTPTRITLKAGGRIIDQYGRNTGRFVSLVGTSYETRALPRNTNKKIQRICY